MAEEKINTKQYISPLTLIPENILLASNWYKTEKKKLDTRFLQMGSQMEGDPLTQATGYGDQTKTIEWMLAQGWQVSNTTAVRDWGYTAVAGTISPSFQWWIITYHLERRVLDPEKALNDLIASFTNAYNAGRDLNSTRYDDILTLYTVMLDRTEDELMGMTTDNSAYEALMNQIFARIEAENNTHTTDVAGGFDTYGESMRLQINTKFDNLVSQTRSALISRGLFNTTTWDSSNSGVERERTLALTDFDDKLMIRRVELKTQLHAVRVRMWNDIIAARQRLFDQLKQADDKYTEMRNRVMQAMLDFMERRTDSYPDLASIAQLTNQLGSGGASYPAP